VKNFLLLVALFSCHVLAAKVEASTAMIRTADLTTEPQYIVVQYSKQEAKQAQAEIGHLPKRHLTPEGSTQVWAVFNEKAPNAERFASYSQNSFIVTRSKFAEVIRFCKAGTITDYNAYPFCAPEFLKLAEIIND